MEYRSAAAFSDSTWVATREQVEAEIARLRAAYARLRAECEASRSVSLASTTRRLLRGSASATSKMIDDADSALIEATAHEDAARRAVDEAGDLRSAREGGGA